MGIGGDIQAANELAIQYTVLNYMPMGMVVDFGHLGLTWDAATRSRRRTWVFSGRLRHCRRAYREVVFDQKQETFFACHMHAFEWFGGVPEKVTPDT